MYEAAQDIQCVMRCFQTKKAINQTVSKKNYSKDSYKELFVEEPYKKTDFPIEKGINK